MLIIQNYYIFNEYQYYHPLRKEITPIEHDGIHSIRSDGVSIHFSGFYSNISKRQIVLFRENTTLYLAIDSQTFPFDPLTISSYTVKKTVSDNHQIFWIRHLTIRLHDHVIMDNDYDDICPTFEPDFTPFVESEDFDFGLFLENLSKDKNRQSQLFQEKNTDV